MLRCLLRVAAGVIALAATCSLTLGTTVSAYSDSAASASNRFTAAADWTPPTASVTAVGRSTAYDTGFINKAAKYYVYADLGDSGNPASGISSATANVSSVTSGSTAVALTPGNFSAGGTSYNYRSAVLTAASNLPGGTYSYSVTSTDMAGNAGTQSFSTVVDNATPKAVDVQSTNVSGGTVGHLDQGDTLTLTFSDTMDPYSILAGWDGTATAVQMALVNGGGSANDSIYVYDTAATPAQIPMGVITLGDSQYVSGNAGNYVTFGATGSATPSTMTRTGAKISFTLGVPSATTKTSNKSAQMTWAPSTTADDIAGNAMSATARSQTGTVHVNF